MFKIALFPLRKGLLLALIMLLLTSCIIQGSPEVENPYRGKVIGVWPVQEYMGKEHPGLLYVVALDPEKKEIQYIYRYTVGNNLMVSLSPNGRYLALNLWDDRGACNVYVLDLKTGKVERLSNLNGTERNMCWLDDQKILYMFGSHEGVPGSRLLIVNRETKEIEDLGKKLNLNPDPQMNLFWAPATSWEKKLIAFSWSSYPFPSRGNALYICHYDGSQLEKIYEEDTFIHNIQFNRDGSQIVLATRWLQEGIYRGKIVLVDLNTKEHKVLVDSTEDFFYNLDPVFISDRTVLFTSAPKSSSSNQKGYNLWQVDTKTGKIDGFPLLLQPERSGRPLYLSLGSKQMIWK
jgi:hypothetical protein